MSFTSKGDAILIAGADEAGRGCIVGPLVICVAVIEEGREAELRKAGAKDSKLLSPSARRRLYAQIKGLCTEARCIHITAKELNELMEGRSLNEIEAAAVAGMLGSLKHRPARIYVDSPDTEARRFERRIRRYAKTEAAIHSEHRADVRYPIVSAASILAKVERDEVIERIKKEWGYDFGSGYTSDPRTIEFLRSNIHRREIRKYLREKWETFERLSQKKLSEF